jgi:hypothetical protein
MYLASKEHVFTILIRTSAQRVLLCEAAATAARGNMTKRSTRKGTTPINVWVLPEEKAAIAEKAKAAGLSQSAYLRNVGLGTPVTGVADQEAVMELVKINADLGRLGGLLKMWLTNDEKLDLEGCDQAGLEAAIIEALREIKATQALMFQKASQL